MDKGKIKLVLEYLRTLLQNQQPLTAPEQYTSADNTLLLFERWNDKKIGTADSLYESINLHNDFDTIFDYSETYQNENPDIQSMWNLMLAVLMAIARIAYADERCPALPQDMEGIRFEEVGGFFSKILAANHTCAELYHYFCHQVCY